MYHLGARESRSLRSCLPGVHTTNPHIHAGGAYVPTVFVGMYAPLTGRAQTCQKTARLRHPWTGKGARGSPLTGQRAAGSLFSRLRHPISV
jgi:hypothetical protein